MYDIFEGLPRFWILCTSQGASQKGRFLFSLFKKFVVVGLRNCLFNFNGCKIECFVTFLSKRSISSSFEFECRRKLVKSLLSLKTGSENFTGTPTQKLFLWLEISTQYFMRKNFLCLFLRCGRLLLGRTLL